MKIINKKNVCALAVLYSAFSFMLSVQMRGDDDNILDKFISSKGYRSAVTFDASNIKQYWVDNSVSSMDGKIRILLKTQKANQPTSIPLRIQLINLQENQDCHLDIITGDSDLSFLVTDTKNKTISTSAKADDFIQDHILTSTFHLEDTQSFTFNLVFQSKTLSEISIKKIILSFPINKESTFLTSPGVIEYDANSFTTELSKGEDYHLDPIENAPHSFSITAKGIRLYSKKKILVSGNTIKNSIRVKNTGKVPVKISLAYRPHSKAQYQIHNRNNAYKNNNKILKVLSAEKNSNRVLVDSYPEWAEKCYLALNAKEDLSDFPNFSFAGPIQSVNKLDNGQAEIVLNNPLTKEIPVGTFTRVHAPYGSMYLNVCSKTLQPEEEVVLSSAIKKDDNFLQYSPQAFCRGTHYVVPILVCTSENEEEATVLINDYSVSY